MMLPQFPTLWRRVSNAGERRYQRVLHASNRLSHAGERLRDQRLSDYQSSPAVLARPRVVVSVFWDFVSLFRTLRRHSG